MILKDFPEGVWKIKSFRIMEVVPVRDHEAAAVVRAVSWCRAGGDYVSGRGVWHNDWVTTVPWLATPSLAR